MPNCDKSVAIKQANTSALNATQGHKRITPALNSTKGYKRNYKTSYYSGSKFSHTGTQTLAIGQALNRSLPLIKIGSQPEYLNEDTIFLHCNQRSTDST